MSDIIKLPKGIITHLGTPSSPALAPFTNEVFLLSTTVAGTTFCENIDSIADELLPNITLTTKRKPNNEHDDMAIAIFYKDTQIGWIPQHDNPIISRLMDCGKIIICKIKTSEWRNKWFKVKVDVLMVE